MPRRRLVSLADALETLAVLAPRSRRELIRGMAAELEALPRAADRARFALGAAWAILRIAITGRLGWARPAWVWLAGVNTGALVTVLDTHASRACLLVPAVITGGALCGSLAPNAPWRSTVAIVAGLAASAIVAPLEGFLDRADLLSLLPLLVVAVHSGAFARRALSATPRADANA